MPALDVVNLLSEGNLKSASFASNAIESGFKMASTGVQVSSDIVNKITASASDFKKIQIDEWYKSNQLILEQKSLDATEKYRDASLALEERKLTYLEEKAEEDRIFQREKLEEANKHKATFGEVTKKLALMESRRKNITSEVDLNNNIIKQLGERLKDPDLIPDKNEYKDVTSKYNAAFENNNALLSKLHKLEADLGSVTIVRDSLAGGFITPEDAESMLGQPLDEIYPDKAKSTATPPSTVPVDKNIPIDPSNRAALEKTAKQLRQRFVDSGLKDSDANDALMKVNKILQEGVEAPAKGAPTVSVNPEDNLWNVEESLEVAARLSAKEGPNNPIRIRNFVEKKSTPEAQQYFEKNRKDKERQFFESLFDDVVYGENAAKKFQESEASFAKHYGVFGGTPEELDKLRLEAKKYNRRIATAEDKEAEVKAVADEVFNTKAQAAHPTGKSGAQMVTPLGTVFGEDPETGRPTMKINEYFEPIPSDKTQPYLKKDKEGFRRYESDQATKENDLYREIYDKSTFEDKQGKRSLTKEARQALLALDPSAFGLDYRSLDPKYITEKYGRGAPGEDMPRLGKKQRELEIKKLQEKRVDQILKNNNITEAIDILTTQAIKHS